MIAYENEPEASESLTVKQLKWLLDQHSIEYKYVYNELKMADNYSDRTDWIEPIMNYGKLMEWMGY